MEMGYQGDGGIWFNLNLIVRRRRKVGLPDSHFSFCLASAAGGLVSRDSCEIRSRLRTSQSVRRR